MDLILIILLFPHIDIWYFRSSKDSSDDLRFKKDSITIILVLTLYLAAEQTAIAEHQWTDSGWLVLPQDGRFVLEGDTVPNREVCDVVGWDPCAFSPFCCSARVLEHVDLLLSSLVSIVLFITVARGRTIMNSLPLHCIYLFYMTMGH